MSKNPRKKQHGNKKRGGGGRRPQLANPEIHVKYILVDMFACNGLKFLLNFSMDEFACAESNGVPASEKSMPCSSVGS